MATHREGQTGGSRHSEGTEAGAGLALLERFDKKEKKVKKCVLFGKQEATMYRRKSVYNRSSILVFCTNVIVVRSGPAIFLQDFAARLERKATQRAQRR